MRKNLNEKGFTLVEVLAVLVILSAIMMIAIPNITSSMDRNKDKQNESKYRMLESFAEIYVADYKNAIYKKLGTNEKCYINISTLKSRGYLSNKADEDADGNPINGYIIFDSTNNSYTYSETNTLDVSDGCYVPSIQGSFNKTS